MKGSILVVDDERDLREVIGKALRISGYTPEMADGVESAVAKLKTGRYHIVLTDKNMPSMEGRLEGGMEVLRYTKEHAPATEVVMMTAFASMESVLEAMQYGAFDYILKPFNIEELIRKLDRIRNFQNFIIPDSIIDIYRSLYAEMAEALGRQCSFSEDSQHSVLRVLNEKVDFIFNILKNFERTMIQQRETLDAIRLEAETLLRNTDPDDPLRRHYLAIRDKAAQ